MYDASSLTYDSVGSVCRFTGKERDSETNLDYFGARYYGSNMGRWLSPDWSADPVPVPFAELNDPQTLNLYGYVRNNPTAIVDDDGHGDSGTFCQAACREAGRRLAAEHPVQAAIVPPLALGTWFAGGLLAPAAGGSGILRGLIGLALANAPQAQRAGETLADMAAPPGTPSFSIAGAAANFGFKSFETAGSIVGGELKGGGAALVSFSKEANELGVRIAAVAGPSGTLSKLEQGAINAAKAEGSSSLKLTATMVRDSLVRLLKKQGFTQEIKDGKATGNWTKVINLRKDE